MVLKVHGRNPHSSLIVENEFWNSSASFRSGSCSIKSLRRWDKYVGFVIVVFCDVKFQVTLWIGGIMMYFSMYLPFFLMRWMKLPPHYWSRVWRHSLIWMNFVIKHCVHCIYGLFMLLFLFKCLHIGFLYPLAILLTSTKENTLNNVDIISTLDQWH